MKRTLLYKKGPEVLSQSARIYEGGANLRLSADICKGLRYTRFSFRLERKDLQLILRATPDGMMPAWKTSPKGFCYVIAVKKILKELGIDPSEAAGVYPVEVKGDVITISLKEKIK